MRRANDQIFQLSLTEVAFTLAFILLLLLGYLLYQANQQSESAERQLQNTVNRGLERDAIDRARGDLAKALEQAGVKPDDIITKLVPLAKAEQERDALKKRVEDLDKQLSALTEVQKTLNATGKGAGSSDVVQKEVTEALALKAKLERQLATQDAQARAPTPAKPSQASPASALAAAPQASGTSHPPTLDVTAEALSGLVLKGQIENQLRKQLGESYVSGQEAQLAKELVRSTKDERDAAKSSGTLATLKKDNADLQGQVDFLKRRLDARGGRDYPPCWAEAGTGKVQYLFTLEILPGDRLAITPAWPESRQADAAALPDIDKLTASTPLALGEFKTAMQGIDRLSKQKNCRHYVYIKNRVTDLESFNKARFTIEDFFYKLELRG